LSNTNRRDNRKKVKKTAIQKEWFTGGKRRPFEERVSQRILLFGVRNEAKFFCRKGRRKEGGLCDGTKVGSRTGTSRDSANTQNVKGKKTTSGTR